MDLFRSLSDVVEFAPAKMKKNPLFATDRCFCDVYAFEPGQAQAGHAHDGSDKIYYVLSGFGDFTVGDALRRVGPGTAVLCPAGSQHGVTNPGPERLSVLVFMSPPPSR